MSDNDRFKLLADTRRSTVPQLWVAGCSISHGEGVDESQRYANVLAAKLGLPLSCLTFIGSSIVWAADQILRSDIVAGDIVVWD